MNVNPKAKRVLCYGDSNTWGRLPIKPERYPLDVRWTGILQASLGSNVEIIEEGLRSRTTDLDDPDQPGRSGIDYLLPCLHSQYPTDLVLIMLGTNDLKSKFRRSVGDVTEAMGKVVDVTREVGKTASDDIPKVVVIAPPPVLANVAKPDVLFEGADEKSLLLPGLYEKLAREKKCYFFDAGKYVQPAKDGDGVHWSPEGHAKLAKVLEGLVKTLLSPASGNC